MLILSVAAIFLWIRCDKSPSKPVEQVSDYDVYLKEDFIPEGKLFIFNTKELSVVDSFASPCWGLNPELSADGKYLYCPDTAISIIDTKTKELVSQLNDTALWIEVAPDGRYFAAFHNSIHIYDATTYELVFSDTGQIWPTGKFTLDGKRLYCPKHGTQIYCLNLDTIPISARIVYYPQALAMSLVPSEDGKYLYVLAQKGAETQLQIFEIGLDSVIYSLTIPAFFSSAGTAPLIDITPNGKYVVFTDGEPSGGFEIPHSSRTVFVFNTTSRALESIIPIFGVDPNYPDGLAPYNFVITPDSRWFISGGQGIIAIDLETKTVRKLIELPNRFFNGITCRKKAK